MSTTHHREAPSLTPTRDARHPARAPESAPSTGSSTSTRHSASVSLAMRLLHRSASAPQGFMSADERAFIEHRRHGAE
jgi:hypothetical protein